MTEAEWLACTDPRPMLKYLRGKVSERKLRWFACACCRRLWHLLSDERSRRAIETTERFADRLADDSELIAKWNAAHEAGLTITEAYQSAQQTILERHPETVKTIQETFRHAMLAMNPEAPKEIIEACLQSIMRQGPACLFALAGSTVLEPLLVKQPELQQAWFALRLANARIGAALAVQRASWLLEEESQAIGVASTTANFASEALRAETPASSSNERDQQCRLLRDLIHNPFRPLRIDPAWLMPKVVQIAQGIYDEPELPSGHLDTGRLTILADTLQETRCTSTDLLAHCRSPGPHVKGCWAVDFILGKS